MNRIKILFLTFVLSLTSVGGLACWDDWDDDWDDWGCCDDWDDDDEVDDEHDDWYYNEETGDYWLYDVEVTGSNDGYKDDWEEGDFGWCDEDDDYNDYNDDNHNHTSITGNSESDKEPKYKLQKTDNLCTARWRLNSLNGFKQGTANTCVPAGMEFVAKLFGVTSITESSVAFSLIQSMGFCVLNGDYSTEKLVDTLINTANSNGLQAKIVDDIKEAINDGAVVMTTKPTEDGNHDIIIVGYNNNGYIAYDTNKSAGYYINIPETEVNSLYKVSIKK